MLARQFRLPATVSFQSACVIHTILFTVRIVPNNLSVNRYGFIVGKKIDKRAVVRNKAKRRARAIVEQEGLLLKGNDVLFVLKPHVKEATHEQLVETMRDILKKLI